MSDAKLEKTNLTIGGSEITEKFVAQAEQVLFDGFLKVYMESHDDETDESEESSLLPILQEQQQMEKIEILATEKFTQKPPRYTEASLVKKLEELGIGRPSTYAPTISTITQRGYIIKEDRNGIEREYVKLTLKGESITRDLLTEISGTERSKLFPQDIGILVTDFLKEHFVTIMDYSFTANIEKGFDKVADGTEVWNELISKFYKPFHSTVDLTTKEASTTNAERILGTDPKSGKVLLVRLGKFGPLVQKGASDDTEKSFASLQKGQLIESITIEDAIKLFELPRKIGFYNDKEIVTNIGRFGPYVKYGSTFVSIGKDGDPYTITEEMAISIIEEHAKKEAEKFIKEFKEEGIQILNGRFGAYLKHGGNNYKIPKDTDASQLELAKCLEIIAAGPSKPKGKPGRKKK